jgi:membrane protein implicated in regulation of membrane protease activity
MPLWLKRSLFLLVVGVAAWVVGYYLVPYGFNWVALALMITVVLAIVGCGRSGLDKQNAINGIPITSRYNVTILFGQLTRKACSIVLRAQAQIAYDGDR